MFRVMLADLFAGFAEAAFPLLIFANGFVEFFLIDCLLYTSDAADD